MNEIQVREIIHDIVDKAFITIQEKNNKTHETSKQRYLHLKKLVEQQHVAVVERQSQILTRLLELGVKLNKLEDDFKCHLNEQHET